MLVAQWRNAEQQGKGNVAPLKLKVPGNLKLTETFILFYFRHIHEDMFPSSILVLEKREGVSPPALLIFTEHGS